MLAVAVIDRVGDTIFSPSSTAALPTIVHDGQLESAWAATEARQYAASLGGPALGGVLFALARSLPFFGDAISYGVSTLTSSMMTGDFAPAPARADQKGLWRESFDGVRLLWRDGFLRAVMIQAPLINFAFSGVIFSVTLALRQHGTSASVIGLTQAGIGAGGLLGAIVAPRLQGRLTISHLVVAITGAGTLLLGTAALVVPSPLVAIPIAATLFLAPAANAALFGALLRRTPAELRGRVNNSLIQVATGLATLAPLIAGVLVERPRRALGDGAVLGGARGLDGDGVEPERDALGRPGQPVGWRGHRCRRRARSPADDADAVPTGPGLSTAQVFPVSWLNGDGFARATATLVPIVTP